eukprot:5447261-Pyramimonas_sp.AAC.1
MSESRCATETPGCSVHSTPATGFVSTLLLSPTSIITMRLVGSDAAHVPGCLAPTFVTNNITTQ